VAFIVEMVGVGGERREFCCSASTWKRALETALQAGWKPYGMAPDPAWNDQWDGHGKFNPDYECDEWGKLVSAEDAAALANALERSPRHLPQPVKAPILIREGMTQQEFGRAKATLDSDFLIEFIRFLRKGGCSFFWDE
jgi:hypothetical protein